MQAFVLVAGGEYILKDEDGVCSISGFITTSKAYPEKLQHVEFNHEEASELQLMGRSSFPKDTQYNCITANDIKDEVKKLANMQDVKAGLHGHADWCVDGTEKFTKVSVKGTALQFLFEEEMENANEKETAHVQKERDIKKTHRLLCRIKKIIQEIASICFIRLISSESIPLMYLARTVVSDNPRSRRQKIFIEDAGKWYAGFCLILFRSH